MLLGPKGDCRIRVAKSPRDGPDVDSGASERGSGKVAQVVEVDTIQSEPVTSGPEHLGDAIRSPRRRTIGLLGPDEGIGHKLGPEALRPLDHPLVVLFKHRDRRRIERQSSRPMRLRILHDQLAAELGYRVRHHERRSLNIDVGPPERAELAPAATRGRCGKDHVRELVAAALELP